MGFFFLLVIGVILGGGVFGDYCLFILDIMVVLFIVFGCDLFEYVRI